MLSRCPNPGSARMRFQWTYFLQATNGSVLNIGSADDPLSFGEGAHHFDIDDWSYCHKRFTQGDAHALPFEDQSWEVVILGDIVEHLYDPKRAISEAARVSYKWLAMTVFEEWRLPGPGKWVKEGQADSDETSRALGYMDRFDAQKKMHPERIGVSDEEIPHLCHIWQFDQEMVDELVDGVVAEGFQIAEYWKAFEITHAGHPMYNWLVAFQRSSQ